VQLSPKQILLGFLVTCYREFQRSAVWGSVREWTNVLMLFLTLVIKAWLQAEIYRPSVCIVHTKLVLCGCLASEFHIRACHYVRVIISFYWRWPDISGVLKSTLPNNEDLSFITFTCVSFFFISSIFQHHGWTRPLFQHLLCYSHVCVQLAYCM
jgi:hypothetical protein